MFTINQVITDHYPTRNQYKVSGPIIKSLLRHLVHEQDFLDFTKECPHLHGIEFIEQVLETLKKEFCEENYRTDFIRLKSLLNNLWTAIPPLYKQYTELCEPGGVVVLDFNVDPAFYNCIDGLIIVDTHKLKPQKRKRYMEETILVS